MPAWVACRSSLTSLLISIRRASYVFMHTPSSQLAFVMVLEYLTLRAGNPFTSAMGIPKERGKGRPDLRNHGAIPYSDPNEIMDRIKRFGSPLVGVSGGFLLPKTFAKSLLRGSWWATNCQSKHDVLGREFRAGEMRLVSGDEYSDAAVPDQLYGFRGSQAALSRREDDEQLRMR